MISWPKMGIFGSKMGKRCGTNRPIH